MMLKSLLEAEAIKEEKGLTDEQKALVIEEISNDMNILYEEVKNVPSLFSKNEAATVALEDSDIVVLRYSYLQCMDKICKDLKQSLKEYPGDDMVIDNMQKVLIFKRNSAFSFK